MEEVRVGIVGTVVISTIVMSRTGSFEDAAARSTGIRNRRRVKIAISL